MLSQIFSSDFPNLLLSLVFQLLSLLGSGGDFLTSIVQAGFAFVGLQVPDSVIKVASIAVAGLLIWKVGGSLGKVVFVVAALVVVVQLLSLIL